MSSRYSIPWREGHFGGVKFRSKLEERWARWFTRIGVEWEYEPEKFQTSKGGYTPDFYLHQFGEWVEIKPNMPTKVERQKIMDLEAKGMSFLIGIGPPPGPWSRGAMPRNTRSMAELMIPVCRDITRTAIRRGQIKEN